ncbi:MAG TPA: methionyl-tRNA formyltransferase [Dehalococcoidia bacterium]|nr:methionyl-tRNA formyltransferase [Dehalococcoidia bacterium]
MLHNVRKKVIFMGTPSFAVPALEAICAGPYSVAAVYTQPDREAGRGRRVAMSPVKQTALAHGLPVEQPERLRDPDVISSLRECAPDVIVVAAYGLMVPKEILTLPQHGCINIHPSLLPRYRGASPVSTVILNGDSSTGVTIMLLDEGMDTGPILAQIEVPISDSDTTGTLTDTIAVAGARLLIDTMPRWLSGEIKPQPQDNSRAVNTRQVSKDDGRIDWSLPAAELGRQVRAYNPWPGSYTLWQGKRLRIDMAGTAVAAGSAEPGRVVSVQRDGASHIAVGTGSGLLVLLSVQLEGKKVTPIHDFIRGYQAFIGSCLG